MNQDFEVFFCIVQNWQKRSIACKTSIQCSELINNHMITLTYLMSIYHIWHSPRLCRDLGAICQPNSKASLAALKLLQHKKTCIAFRKCMTCHSEGRPIGSKNLFCPKNTLKWYLGDSGRSSMPSRWHWSNFVVLLKTLGYKSSNEL